MIPQKLFPPFFAAICLIFLLSALPNITTFDYNDKRLFEVFFLFITLLTSAFSNLPIVNILNRESKLILELILLLGILSCIFSVNPQYAFIELITLLSLFIASSFISQIWNKQQTIPISITTLIFGVFLLEIKFLAYYFAFIFSGTGFSIHDFFPSFANARFFNQYQIWTLPFLTFILTEQSIFKKINKYLLLYIAITWWAMFFTTGSRGAVLSVVTALCLVKFFFRDKSSEFIKVTLFISISGFTVYQFLFHAIPYLINQDSKLLLDSLEIRLQSSGRVFLWEKAINFTINNPILGIGPMHFAWQDINNITPSRHLNHPHNSFLQWGAEWGLISLSLISYLIIYSLRKWFTKFNYKTVTNTDAPLAITLTFSVISALTYSLFSGVIVMPMSQLMWVFIISIMIAKYNDELPIKINNSFYLNYLLIPIALFYFYLLCPQLIEIIFNDDTSTIRSNLAPRFWVDGDIF